MPRGGKLTANIGDGGSLLGSNGIEGGSMKIRLDLVKGSSSGRRRGNGFE